MGGHSFGGGTALKVANSDPRVTTAVTMDPWLLPFKDLIEKSNIANLCKKPI